MSNEKITVSDRLSIKLVEAPGVAAAPSKAAKVPKASKAGPKKSASSGRSLSGTGPWYLFTDLDPFTFYAVYDMGVAHRILHQKCWHALRASTVAWRVNRMRGHTEASKSSKRSAAFEKETLQTRIEMALLVHLDRTGAIAQTSDVLTARWVTRLYKICTGGDVDASLQPVDVGILSDALGIPAIDLYVRSGGLRDMRMFSVRGPEMKEYEYPWEALLVYAPNPESVKAWIQGQWLFRHLEAQETIKDLNTRMIELDRVLRAPIEVVPYGPDHGVVVLPHDKTTATWSAAYRTQGEVATSMIDTFYKDAH
jgi:hypothetical protein